jgi:hypothetical protein
LVTLIPKSSDAKTMKDMRPIACCTTMYKIISKILTTCLSKVITAGPAQKGCKQAYSPGPPYFGGLNFFGPVIEKLVKYVC